MNKNNIIIAMATYNGETYLEEQIESIINQSYQNWRLIIQDDGSTDDTIGIVHKYISQDQRICLVKNDSNEHNITQINQSISAFKNCITICVHNRIIAIN